MRWYKTVFFIIEPVFWNKFFSDCHSYYLASGNGLWVCAYGPLVRRETDQFRPTFEIRQIKDMGNMFSGTTVVKLQFLSLQFVSLSISVFFF